jgi:hypothetical protein
MPLFLLQYAQNTYSISKRFQYDKKNNALTVMMGTYTDMEKHPLVHNDICVDRVAQHTHGRTLRYEYPIECIGLFNGSQKDTVSVS